MANIDAVMKELNKKFGSGVVMKASEAKALDITRIPTGSIALDIITGGGIPESRVTLITGGYSCGKTAVATKIVAQAQKLFKKRFEEGTEKVQKKCCWIDAEGAFENEWAEKLGVDVDSLVVCKPEYGEQALDIADVMTKTDDIGLIVLDSIAALVPQAEADESMNKLFMGDAAKMNNKFFRKLSGGMNGRDLGNVGDKAPTVILINQVREKIGVMYGNPNTLPGGKGQEYSASIILELRRGDWIQFKMDKNGTQVEEVVGQWVKATATKNKTAPPKRTGEFRFFFNDTPYTFKAGDIDTAEEIVRYAIKYGIIKRRGAYYEIEGRPHNIQGQDNVVKELRDDTELLNSMYDRIMQIAVHNKPEVVEGESEGSSVKEGAGTGGEE